MMQDQRMKVVMEKMKQSLLLRLAALQLVSSSTIHSPHISSLIDNRLQQVFKSFHTRTHPSYHSMIKRVVKESNEKSGLTQEEISKFISKEYDKDLPFDHASILHIHLKKLCMNGELMCTENGKYVLVDCESETEEVEEDGEEDEEQEEEEEEDHVEDKEKEKEEEEED